MVKEPKSFKYIAIKTVKKLKKQIAEANTLRSDLNKILNEFPEATADRTTVYINRDELREWRKRLRVALVRNAPVGVATPKVLSAGSSQESAKVQTTKQEVDKLPSFDKLPDSLLYHSKTTKQEDLEGDRAGFSQQAQAEDEHKQEEEK